MSLLRWRFQSKSQSPSNDLVSARLQSFHDAPNSKTVEKSVLATSHSVTSPSLTVDNDNDNLDHPNNGDSVNNNGNHDHANTPHRTLTATSLRLLTPSCGFFGRLSQYMPTRPCLSLTPYTFVVPSNMSHDPNPFKSLTVALFS